MGKVKLKPPRINRLFLYTDNVSQHFKITGYVSFITNLFKDRKNEYPTATILITFGCPGHGKGAWLIVLKYTFSVEFVSCLMVVLFFCQGGIGLMWNHFINNI